jgi:hypothetical protein
MADSNLLTTKKNLREIKNNKKNINSIKQEFDNMIKIWNKKIQKIKFVNRNINDETYIILNIYNDLNKKYKEILVLCIKIIDSGKIIYDWKNNFSKLFLDKIFSLNEVIGYSILDFYYTLLNYIKNQQMPKFDIYEYIYFVLNIYVESINFFNRKIELILQDIILKNIISRKIFEFDKSSFDSYYSYDYYIDTYLKDTTTLNKNGKINISKLENKFLLDFKRSPTEYFFHTVQFNSNHYITDNNKEIHSSIAAIKGFTEEYLKNKKYEKKQNIYIKILQSLYQVIFNKCMYYLVNELILKYTGGNVIPEIVEKKYNIKEEGDNIIIECVNNINFCIIDENDSKKYFLNVIITIKIDILNNIIHEKISFIWTNETIRQAIDLWIKIGINGFISAPILEKIYDEKSLIYLLDEIYSKSSKTNKKIPEYHKKIVIINLNEKSKHFSHFDCFTYLCTILIKDPLFVLVSTQDSTTRLVKGESVSFQHILKEGLEILGYTYTIKDYDIKSFSYKSGFTRDVNRIRLYKKNVIENSSINNAVISKENSSLVVKLNYFDKYLFFNLNFIESNSEEEKFKYFFTLITRNIDIFDYQNRLTIPQNVLISVKKNIVENEKYKINHEILQSTLNKKKINQNIQNKFKKMENNGNINRKIMQEIQKRYNKIKKINDKILKIKKKDYNLIDLFINNYNIYFLSSININFLKNQEYGIINNSKITTYSKRNNIWDKVKLRKFNNKILQNNIIPQEHFKINPIYGITNNTNVERFSTNSYNSNNNQNFERLSNNSSNPNVERLSNNSSNSNNTNYFSTHGNNNENFGRLSNNSSNSNNTKYILARENSHSGGNRKFLINMKNIKNNNTLLSKLIDDYLDKKIVFNEKRPILSFTQTQKNKIIEYDNKIKIFKDGYRNQIYGFFSSLKNCGGNEMSLCAGLNNDVEII